MRAKKGCEIETNLHSYEIETLNESTRVCVIGIIFGVNASNVCLGRLFEYGRTHVSRFAT